MKTKDQLIDDLLTLAFAEDVGDGDHTTLSTIPDTERGVQRLIVKEEGILAGVDIARMVFEKFDPEPQDDSLYQRRSACQARRYSL